MHVRLHEQHECLNKYSTKIIVRTETNRGQRPVKACLSRSRHRRNKKQGASTLHRPAQTSRQNLVNSVRSIWPFLLSSSLLNSSAVS